MPSQAHGKWSSEMRTGDLSFIPFVQLVIVHVGQAQAQARVFGKGIPFQCIASNLWCIYRSFRSSILWSLSSHQTSKTTSNQTIKPSSHHTIYDPRLGNPSKQPWSFQDSTVVLKHHPRTITLLSNLETKSFLCSLQVIFKIPKSTFNPTSCLSQIPSPHREYINAWLNLVLDQRANKFRTVLPMVSLL